MPPAYYWIPAVLGLLIAILALDVMGFFSSKNHFPVEGRTVLVTGASQGMGKVAARMLAAKGANVVIVARDEGKLAAAVEEMKAHAKHPETQRFHYISADVTSAAENARLLQEATVWNDGFPPDIVWAIAGASKPTLFLDSSIETMRAQMDLNYWAAVYLARETIQAWRSPSSHPPTNTTTTDPLARHIVLTSSLISFVPIIGYSPYGPAKAAIRNFSDSVRQELHLYNATRHRQQPSSTSSAAHPPPPPTDMLLHVVFPGTIDSPGLQTENEHKHSITKKLEATDPIQSEEAVAGGALKGLERGDFFVMTDWWGRLLAGSSWGLSKRSSWWQDWGIAWLANGVMQFVVADQDREIWLWGCKWGLGEGKQGVKG